MINNLLKIGNPSKNEKSRNILGRLFAIGLISIILTTSAFPITTGAQSFIPENATQDQIFRAAAGNDANRDEQRNADLNARTSLSTGSSGSVQTTATTGTNPASTGQTSQSNNSGLANVRPTDDDVDCGGLSFFKEFQWCVANTMLQLSGKILFLSGVLLNHSIDLSVIKMKEMVNGIPAVGFVWTAFRDLANIFFIFVLIFIAFKTILGMDQKETMKMLIKVIIVGLFINFSLVFTKMAIDASNIVAIQFYKSMQIGNDPSRGLSAALTDGMRLPTVYNIKDPKSLGSINAIPIGFMGSIFFLVAAFVFLAAAIMFIVRFVTLLILMMTSPIVMALSMIPGSGPSRAVSEWISSLTKQLIFAPVFMMMMWVVVMVVSRSRTLVPGDNGTTLNFATAMTGSGVDSIAVILNFVVVIALTISALTIARMAGGSSFVGDKFIGLGKSLGLGAISGVAGGAVGGAIGLTGWAGRRTIGGAASNILNADESTWRGKFAKSIKDKAPTSTINRLGLNTLKGVANSSFDVRAAPLGIGKTLTKQAGGLGINIGKAQEGGFEAKMKAQKERELQKAKDLGEGKVYSDDATKAEVAKLEKEKKDHEAEIKKKDAEIAAAKAAGKTEAEIKILEDQKLKAITDRAEKKKKIEDIHNDPSKTKTRQEAYAESASKGKAESILGYVARKAGGDGKSMEVFARNVWSTRGNRDAAKELTKEVDKKTETYNQKWAEKAGVEKAKEIDAALEPLIKAFKDKTDELNAIKKVSTLDPSTGKMVEDWAPADHARRAAITDSLNKTRKQIDDFRNERKKVEPYAKKQQYKNILDAVNSMAGVVPPNTTATPPPSTP